MDRQRPKKLQRISQACDLCHGRSIRCRPSTENPLRQCQNCFDFAVDCTFKRPSRRKRIRPNAEPSIAAQTVWQSPHIPEASAEGDPARNAASVGHLATAGSIHLETSDDTGAYAAVRHGAPRNELGTAWRAFAQASHEAIFECIEFYIHRVFPIFPFFHIPTLRIRIQEKDHLRDRGFFASILAACALAAARSRDGVAERLQQHRLSAANSSEIFFAASQDALMRNFLETSGVDFLKTCALLALTSLQYGKIRSMHQFAGHYFTLSAMERFHDEKRWPPDLSLAQKEERRRLFWSMYTFDVYSSVVFGTLMRSQESHSNVCYPSGMTDEGFSASNDTGDSWIRGWNFTTDLYRVLEYLSKRLRDAKSDRSDRISVVNLIASDGISKQGILENILALYTKLPERFRNYGAPMSGEPYSDVYCFQAANIQATLQLVRMTLFSIDEKHGLEDKCAIAEQVLNTFHDIDPQVLLAISTPLVYHLGGIGEMLSSITESLLSEESYRRVRALLISMADLLSRLETGLPSTVGGSQRLKIQIKKMDEYVDSQKMSLSGPPPGTAHLTSLPSELNEMTNGSAPDESFDCLQLPYSLTEDAAWPWPFFTEEPHVPTPFDF